MILGRNILTGQLVYGNGTPICRHCWNGKHHRCTSNADKFNKCECDSFFNEEHALGTLFKEMRNAA